MHRVVAPLLLGITLAFACEVKPLEPCASGNDNHLNSKGECECNVGFEFCNGDSDDLACCEDPAFTTTAEESESSSSEEESEAGTSSEGTDESDGGDTGDETGDETGGDACDDEAVAPPESCTEDEEGAFWCTHSSMECLESSETYVCMGGEWTRDEVIGDLFCRDDDFDFAYGCMDTGVVEFVCGDGPGSACETGDPATCEDGDVIAECIFGKLSTASCTTFCQEVGVDGTMFELGECVEGRSEADCVCSDP